MVRSTTERERGSIHFARLDKSPRLQQLLAFLRSRGERGATTADILDACPLVRAVSAAACELERNGFPVECKAEAFTGDGGRVYRYTLRESEAAGVLPPAADPDDDGPRTSRPWRERLAEVRG